MPRTLAALALLPLLARSAHADPRIAIASPAKAAPLDTVTVVGAGSGTLVVEDGAGHAYARLPASPRTSFVVGGALGAQRIKLVDASGRVSDELTFDVDAQTKLDDHGGRYGELFTMSRDTMLGGSGRQGVGSVTYRGKPHHFFVSWVLDHSNTTKGMQYFSPIANEATALWRDSQKPDGMIWSFVRPDSGPGHFDTAYGHLGYVAHEGGVLFVRQPVENHVEYEYVNMLWEGWKGSGDDAFMTKSLDSALRALDYSITDKARWSKRYQLLKRVYTIDSWDFQADDKYVPPANVAPTMLMDPERSKFGIFFGDNTGYAQACARLAEMLDVAGRKADADKLRRRGVEILDRLTKLSWNGRFFRHFVEEDDTVKRDFGVDEATQIAQGNTYSLNRGISHEQAVAIIKTYQDLRQHLPPGSPGEWYAIHPPFERGFGSHNGKWQYMNGGVAGHAAGELARGAFEHGFERYAVSVLDRSRELAKRTDGKIHFAYTGAFTDDTAPSTPAYTTLDLSHAANMDTSDQGGHGVPRWLGGDPGNDLRGLPPELKVKDVPFKLLDPAKNGHRAAIGVGTDKGLRPQAEVAVGGKQAAGLYLLHAAGKDGGGGIAGAVVFKYADGSQRGVYVRHGRHVAHWWYPTLAGDAGAGGANAEANRRRAGDDAGVAWRGPNAKSSDVGLYWAALPNPEPAKKIRSLVFKAADDGTLYGVVAATLADRLPEKPVSPISYGGPDNWAGANMMAALVEGLAGVVDADRAFGRVRLSPRWTAAGVDAATVTIRYPASKGYVAYRYRHDAAARAVDVTATGNARDFAVRVLLPEGASARTAEVDGRAVPVATSTVEASRYAEVTVPGGAVRSVRVRY